MTTIDRFHCTSNVGAWEAGCFRQVAALYSVHYRQVSLYIKCLDQGRLAALQKALNFTPHKRYRQASSVQHGAMTHIGVLIHCTGQLNTGRSNQNDPCPLYTEDLCYNVPHNT